MTGDRKTIQEILEMLELGALTLEEAVKLLFVDEHGEQIPLQKRTSPGCRIGLG